MNTAAVEVLKRITGRLKEARYAAMDYQLGLAAKRLVQRLGRFDEAAFRREAGTYPLRVAASDDERLSPLIDEWVKLIEETNN